MENVKPENIHFNEKGLIPAIVQDARSGEILMMAWMNKESLQKTLEARETWFYSRSRQKLWHKGEESGHIQHIERLGLAHLPVCIAKTQKSFTNNEALVGRPIGFDFSVREFEIAAGAGFLVPIAGAMMRLPGLPALPAALHIDIDERGVISGLS